MNKPTFAKLLDACDCATRGLMFNVCCALSEAADNAIHSEVLVSNEFVRVGDNCSPLFDGAALDSLATVMSCNVLGWSDAEHADVAAWLAARGFTF
ncbi:MULTISPECIES: hypothetical protein [Burkholderia]|jgi:hypothetical protein|uniref:Uncharacterized protein n=1 Tax=Burkholderia contaminans TaxID=488447 RepID=A0A1E3FSL7_9BURK|nr:hypothetical protein [Burkholderia contaminans]ELK7725858.1 hypothetical protein [Burkholderia cenocepacia]UTP27897.1 hypothetical protein NMB33_40380 [Burkholderia sp. FXe9]HBN6129029.1 hypothetical protein [Clostridioides difficile]MBA9833385.1 hypothetical protein [Burkholderia contaminans]MBH9693756.1 hypothetical protein [Burkholderia contaminans]